MPCPWRSLRPPEPPRLLACSRCNVPSGLRVKVPGQVKPTGVTLRLVGTDGEGGKLYSCQFCLRADEGSV